ncbi:transcriptional regulator, BadM/Rrf2 family [Anaerolinea thermolimosa]|nr:Rrf2 family transcriptional regulator [Anaerolinea thermolimosa]GAP05476.1 transcriptional regulator, BadM/Rrf2 family [Anaerolinea thermolimosa]
MFRISRRLDYGLQLMTALAQSDQNHAQATASLADRLGIPLPFLHQIGRSLIQGGLIKATPGPRGGLRLNRRAEDITLLQIVETLEGPVRITPEPNGNGNHHGVNTQVVWESLQNKVMAHLSSIRLSEIASGMESTPEKVFTTFASSN